MAVTPALDHILETGGGFREGGILTRLPGSLQLRLLFCRLSASLDHIESSKVSKQDIRPLLRTTLFTSQEGLGNNELLLFVFLPA